MKKLLSLILVLAMALSMLVLPAFAEAEGADEGSTPPPCIGRKWDFNKLC